MTRSNNIIKNKKTIITIISVIVDKPVTLDEIIMLINCKLKILFLKSFCIRILIFAINQNIIDCSTKKFKHIFKN